LGGFHIAGTSDRPTTLCYLPQDQHTHALMHDGHAQPSSARPSRHELDALDAGAISQIDVLVRVRNRRRSHNAAIDL